MTRQTVRLALATAALCMGLGAGGRGEAGGIALSTPAGLIPGDSFRFVFLTDGATAATSANIADYNNFVNAQAGGATYNGSVVTWAAIGSTPTVNAIDNVGQTNTPVYLADGTLVTTSTTISGMWSGGILSPIDEDLSGKLTNPDPYNLVWTGTATIGVGALGEELGNVNNNAIAGAYVFTDGGWVSNQDFVPQAAPMGLYGISQVLTVQAAAPEPSTLSMAGMATLVGAAFGWSRRRGHERRPRRAGQPDVTE
jgi:hypothetical protein